MKRYTVATVRERLAEALDAAEQGVPVVIERRGVRYTLSVEPRVRRAPAAKRVLTVLDEAIDGGQWTWSLGPGGAHFTPRAR